MSDSTKVNDGGCRGTCFPCTDRCLDISSSVCSSISSGSSVSSSCIMDEDATLFANLDEYLHEVIDKISSEIHSLGDDGKQNMSLQALRTLVFLKVLEWYGMRWPQLRDLTNETVYVQPEIATRLSEVIASTFPNNNSGVGIGEDISPVMVLLHQLFVRPERMGRALSVCSGGGRSSSSKSKKCSTKRNAHHTVSNNTFNKSEFTFCLGKGGSALDEMDAILAVDGLGVVGGETVPNFDLKRYVDNCRFPFSFHQPDGKLLDKRDYMFEQGTQEDDDRRMHVFAVRDLYTRLPMEQLLQQLERDGGLDKDATGSIERIACRVVYKTIREAFRRVSGGTVVLPPLPASNSSSSNDVQPTSATLVVDATKEEAMDSSRSSSSSSDESDAVEGGEPALTTPVETLEDSLIPHLVDLYVANVKVDRVKRLAKRLFDEKKPEKRGRKRKVEDLTVSDGSTSSKMSGKQVSTANTPSSKPNSGSSSNTSSKMTKSSKSGKTKSEKVKKVLK